MKSKLYTFLSLLILVSSCSKNDCSPQIIENCSYSKELNPVCGCDNVTYGNPGMAKCNNVEFTMGRCVYSIEELLGTWEFLGYVSDGAAMNVDKKVHPYDMFITFKSERGVTTGGEYYRFEGKSVVNFFGGEYHFINKGIISTFISFTTKIGVKDEDAASEYKFVDFLSTDSSIELQGNFLQLKARIYSQDGLTTPMDEFLIFKKK
jgi:hypothetical protein